MQAYPLRLRWAPHHPSLAPRGQGPLPLRARWGPVTPKIRGSGLAASPAGEGVPEGWVSRGSASPRSSPEWAPVPASCGPGTSPLRASTGARGTGEAPRRRRGSRAGGRDGTVHASTPSTPGPRSSSVAIVPAEGVSRGSSGRLGGWTHMSSRWRYPSSPAPVRPRRLARSEPPTRTRRLRPASSLAAPLVAAR